MLLSFTRNQRIPLNIRRQIALWFVRVSSRKFSIDVGSPYHGRLDNYIDFMVYVSGQYFEYPYINFVRACHKGGVALDVGANIGNHALAYSEFFDRVFAIEPYEPLFRRTQARREVSARISAHQVALSDQAGTLAFEQPTAFNQGIGRVSPEGKGSVTAVTGDEFVRTEVRQTVDFIKIDVEGHEMEVIRGLAETLKRDRPTVLFEASKQVMKSAESMQACFAHFPVDYAFFRLGGQSTWPVQRDMARAYPIDRSHPRPRRGSCDLIGFAAEKIPAFLRDA